MSFILSSRARRGTPRVVRTRGQWFSTTTHSGLTWESLSTPSQSWPLCGDHQRRGYQTWAPCWCTAGRASGQSGDVGHVLVQCRQGQCAGWDEAGDWSPVNSTCAQTKHRESSCGPCPLWTRQWESVVQLYNFVTWKHHPKKKSKKELCSFEEKLTDLISSFSEIFLVSSYNCRETVGSA